MIGAAQIQPNLLTEALLNMLIFSHLGTSQIQAFPKYYLRHSALQVVFIILPGALSDF